MFFGMRFFKIFFLSFCSFKTAYLNDLQVSLVSILEDYKETRQQREEEKKRYRVKKKQCCYVHRILEMSCN